jgi:phosphoribosylglycinamide formyltransferase-1
MTLRLGWFSTARGSGSRAMLTKVLNAIDSGDFDARIEFVFSNRERGEGDGSDTYFDLVEGRGIPLVTHSSRVFRESHNDDFAGNRVAYDEEVRQLLSSYQPDFSVLAGYMLIWSPVLCQAFTAINLHPALPDGPIGMWQEVIWQLIDSWSLESGASVFLVTEELDRGPSISYARFPMRGWRFDDMWMHLEERTSSDIKAAEGEDHSLFRALRQEEVQREPHLLLETLKVLARGDITVTGRNVVDANGTPAAPLDLTKQVEAALEPSDAPPARS